MSIVPASFCISGLCLGSLGSSCIPKKSWIETHSIVIHLNNTSYCTSIELEHHRGPCRCECTRKPSSCHVRQQFLPDSCSCQCLPGLASEKSVCTNSSVHRWDSDSCQCSCKQNTRCHPVENLNTTSCICEELTSQLCSIGTRGNAKVYMINVIVLLLVIIIIASTLYWLMIRKRMNSYSSQHSYLQTGSESQATENVLIDGYNFPLAKDMRIIQVIHPELAVTKNNY